MKALSVKRPWAYMILHGVPLYVPVDNGDGTQRIEYSGKRLMKDVENRSWPVPQKMAMPQRIYIHVSLRDAPFDDELIDFCCRKIGIPIVGLMMMYFDVCRRGVLAGEVTLTACVTESKSPFFVGPYGFVVSEPVLYEKPIPCKGKRGFFEPDIEGANG